MSREIYYSEPTLDFKDEVDKHIGYSSYGKTPVPLARARICRFDEESDSTEYTFVRKLKRRTLSHALVSCMLRKEISQPALTTPAIIKGNPKEIFLWYSTLPKDEEFANILDEVVDRMRELKLR